MSEPLPTRIRKAIEDNLAATIGATTLLFLTTLWTLHAPGVYRRLFVALEDKGIVALLFGLVVATVWCAVGWRSEKKKEKTFFERLIPVPGAGYSRDPRNGEFACPYCVSEGRNSYLAQLHDGALYCQACNAAIKRFKTKE
jgi:hypothetical protein